MADIGSVESVSRTGGTDKYSQFVAQVMSDVYALIDFLSGRANPSLASPEYHRPSGPASRKEPASRKDMMDGDRQVQPEDTLAARDKIEADLEHPTVLIQRAMDIGQSLTSNGANPNDAAFLVNARDLLNLRAAPATGSSIVFTLLVIRKLHGIGNSQDDSPFIYANEHLESAARRLAQYIHLSLWLMVALLVVTLALSTYVAWGKLLLDTRDAVLRDFGANETALSAKLAADPVQGPLQGKPAGTEACNPTKLTFATAQACQQHDEVNRRKDSILNHMKTWIPLPIESDETAVQMVVIAVGVLGNYILPVLYGALGAMGSMLRQFNRRLAERLLTPRDRRAASIRVMLGVMTGACIGLFFNSSTGLAQTTGVGGAAVTLSVSAIAFLAGYGVEAVFKLLDGLLNHVFRLDGGARFDTADSRRTL